MCLFSTFPCSSYPTEKTPGIRLYVQLDAIFQVWWELNREWVRYSKWSVEGAGCLIGWGYTHSTCKKDNGTPCSFCILPYEAISFLHFTHTCKYKTLDLAREVNRLADTWHNFIPPSLPQFVSLPLYMPPAVMDPSSDDNDECYSVQLDSSDISPKASKVTTFMHCLPISMLHTDLHSISLSRQSSGRGSWWGDIIGSLMVGLHVVIWEAHRACVISASAVAVQASSLEDAACSLKKGECDCVEIKLNELLIGPLCMHPFFVQY
jgi:hypothetical protein